MDVDRDSKKGRGFLLAMRFVFTIVSQTVRTVEFGVTGVTD